MTDSPSTSDTPAARGALGSLWRAVAPFLDILGALLIFGSWLFSDAISQHAEQQAQTNKAIVERIQSFRIYDDITQRSLKMQSTLVRTRSLVEQLADASGQLAGSDADRRQAVEGCLRMLDEAKRDLILQVHHPGVTVREYARQQSRPEQAVYKSVHRLRQRLLD